MGRLAQGGALHPLGHALGISAVVAQQVVESRVLRQGQRKTVRAQQVPVGAGRQARLAAEGLVEARGALEPDCGPQVQQGRGAALQPGTGRLDAGPLEESRGLGVGMIAEQSLQLGEAHAGHLRQGSRLGKGSGIRQGLAHGVLQPGQVRILAPVEGIRPTSFAGPQARRPGRALVREEPHIAGQGLPRRAGGQAVDSGGEDARKHPPVEGDILRQDPFVEVLIRPAHGSMLGALPRRSPPKVGAGMFSRHSQVRGRRGWGGALGSTPSRRSRNSFMSRPPA